MSNVRSANSVSQRLRARGIKTGYKYTQTGYLDSKGDGFSEPGVMVSRQRQSRYGGREDVGGVEIFLVADSTGTLSPSEEFIGQVEAALTDAGLPYRRNKAGDLFTVPDDEPAPVDDSAEPETAVPATPSNPARASRALAALDAYRLHPDSDGGIEEPTLIECLIADLLHLVDLNASEYDDGIDADRVLATAKAHYTEEREG